MQNVIMVIGMWVIIESFVAADKMDKGDKASRLAKYGFACASGIIGVLLGWLDVAHWTHAVMLVAVGLFLWPVVRYRLFGKYRNRIGD